MQYIAFIATRANGLLYPVYENNTVSLDCVIHAKRGTI